MLRRRVDFALPPRRPTQARLQECAFDAQAGHFVDRGVEHFRPECLALLVIGAVQVRMLVVSLL